MAQSLTPRWEAYGELFKFLESKLKCSRPELVDLLNADAKRKNLFRCTYSVRSTQHWHARPKRGKPSRLPRPERIEHVYKWITEELTKLGAVDKLCDYLAAIAPEQNQQVKKRVGDSDTLPKDREADELTTIKLRTEPAEQALPHNLPEVPSPFFDSNTKEVRQKMVEKLGQNGLIVLHDISGVGKTTFAKHAAHDAVQKKLLPGGAVWINCETEPSPEECERTMCQVLFGGYHEVAPSLARAELERYLERHHTLLVFDNFESVITNDALNLFLSSWVSKASVLVTTKEIHDGMRPYVELFPEFHPADALRLFSLESKLTDFSEEDVRTVERLCGFVGNLPLAVTFLARRATTTTLAGLESALHKNFALLATDDRFRDTRQRSMSACFLTSFEPLSAEDRDILFRLSVAPYGVGKTLVEKYLGAPAQLIPSLNRCLNAGLLRLEKDRYGFHPLVRLFLFDQMGPHRMEWDCCFIDFYCSELEKRVSTPSDQWKDLALVQEMANCQAAMDKAGASRQVEYFLLINEFRPESWSRSYDYYQSYRVEEVTWVDGILEKARLEKDKNLEERALILKLNWRITDVEHARQGVSQLETDPELDALLKRLALLNPRRSEGIRLDIGAYCRLNRGELLPTEKLLQRSVIAWSRAGPQFSPNCEAAQVNLLLALARQDKSAGVTQLSDTLWKARERGFQCRLELNEEGILWAKAITPFEHFFDDSSRTSSELDLVESIGSYLLALKLWGEAERWFVRAESLELRDRLALRLGKGYSILLALGEIYLNLGFVEKAHDAFYETWEDSGCLTTQAHALIGIAEIFARQGDFERAIGIGHHAVGYEKRFLDELEQNYARDRKSGDPNATPPDHDDLREMSALIAGWRKAKKTRTRRKK